VPERVALGQLFRLTPAWSKRKTLLPASPVVNVMSDLMQQNVLQQELIQVVGLSEKR